MKKVFLVLSLLICGQTFAQEVTYSLTDLAIKIIQSSALSPSGKVFLMGYFEDLDPIEFEVNSLSQTLCEEAKNQKVELFQTSRKSCETNLIYFLTNLEKSGEISAGGSVTNGPGGTTVTADIKITIKF